MATMFAVSSLNEYTLYQHDITALSALSEEEERQLLHRLRLAQQGDISIQAAHAARHRLIEGYLHVVIKIARHQQYLFHYLSLADLIQEGNIGLLQAVTDYDCTALTGRFGAYVTTCIRNAIIRALPQDGLIRVPRWEFWQLAQQGRLKDLDQAQPCSLDASTDWGYSLQEVLPASPPFASASSPSRREQVDELLSRLTCREQTVMRLLYGLEETDGRTLTPKEIATLLGVVPGTIQQTIHRALRKLRAVPSIAPSASTMPCHQAASKAEKHRKHLAWCAEQKTKAEAAYARLEAQGKPITMLVLAQEAQVGTRIANTYLCHRWGTVEQRLERAYAERVPEAGTLAITVEQLAKAARVSERAASDFLHWQRGTRRQARPRRQVGPTLQQP